MYICVQTYKDGGWCGAVRRFANLTDAQSYRDKQVPEIGTDWLVYELTPEDVDVNGLKQMLQTDLETQKKAVEIALAEVKKIERILVSEYNMILDAEDALWEINGALLKVAQILAANTAETSTAVHELLLGENHER